MYDRIKLWIDCVEDDEVDGKDRDEDERFKVENQ